MVLQQLDNDLDVVMVVLDRYDAHDVGRVLGVGILAVFVGQHQTRVSLFHLYIKPAYETTIISRRRQPRDRWPSHAVDHRAVYTAPRRVSANVVGCIGSICCGFVTQQLYNKLYNKSNQWSLRPTLRAMPVRRQTVTARGVVNTSLPAVTVYIALAYRRCAVAKFCKSRVLD